MALRVFKQEDEKRRKQTESARGFVPAKTLAERRNPNLENWPLFLQRTCDMANMQVHFCGYSERDEMAGRSKRSST